MMAPVSPEKVSAVQRGRALFEGMVAKGQPFPVNSCASCHTPSLRLKNSEVFVRDPRYDPSQYLKNLFTLVASEPPANLPIQRTFSNRLYSAVSKGGFSALSISSEMAPEPYPDPGYHFDLSMKNPDNLLTEDSAPESYPRLLENADGSIDVPLFSDLKRHAMGVALADRYAQETDATGIFVPAEEFLTRPLWGVADTGPWLHDGRARTLREAILLHDSTGSDAHEAIVNFRDHLSPEQQDDIIEFLLTLRLPVDFRHSADAGSLPPSVHPAPH
jgi:cytochrome c peroxidase